MLPLQESLRYSPRAYMALSMLTVTSPTRRLTSALMRDAASFAPVREGAFLYVGMGWIGGWRGSGGSGCEKYPQWRTMQGCGSGNLTRCT